MKQGEKGFEEKKERKWRIMYETEEKFRKGKEIGV